jgi:hypothetical protein
VVGDQDAGPAGQHDAKVDEYNQRYLNAARPVMQRVQEDWVLFNRVMSGDLTLRKILTTITICLGVLYLFVPFDLIPDSAGSPSSFFFFSFSLSFFTAHSTGDDPLPRAGGSVRRPGGVARHRLVCCGPAREYSPPPPTHPMSGIAQRV